MNFLRRLHKDFNGHRFAARPFVNRETGEIFRQFGIDRRWTEISFSVDKALNAFSNFGSTYSDILYSTIKKEIKEYLDESQKTV
jgi:hypothetical protein